MNKKLILIACILLLLAALVLAVLAISYHRVVVVEGIAGTPIPGAYISYEHSSGSPVEVGRTDANGELAFWTSPLRIPQRICAQSTFYATNCVGAISLKRQAIQLAVPAGSP
jgi:hypothetical protein